MDAPLPEKSGPIDAIKTPDDISKEPSKLPAGFEWVNINFKD